MSEPRSVKIRARLCRKDSPRADQMANRTSEVPVVQIEIADGAHKFEHGGKRYKIVEQEGRPNEWTAIGALETDAVEIWGGSAA